jgi:hypothetical protein
MLKVEVNGDGADRSIYATCTVHGCTKKGGAMRISCFPDSAIDFGNVTKHFETHHFDLLSVEDQDGGNRNSGKKEVPNSSSMPDFPDENEQKVHQAENERFHSLSGSIMKKLRSRM